MHYLHRWCVMQTQYGCTSNTSTIRSSTSRKFFTHTRIASIYNGNVVLLESERFEAFRPSRARVYITRGCSHVESKSILPPISLGYEPGRRAFTIKTHELLPPLRHGCKFFSRLPSFPTPFVKLVLTDKSSVAVISTFQIDPRQSQLTHSKFHKPFISGQ